MVLFGLDLADVTVLRLYQTFSLESSVITACVFLVCVCVCVIKQLCECIYVNINKSNLPLPLALHCALQQLCHQNTRNCLSA